ESFRRNLLFSWGRKINIPDEYTWRVLGSASPARTLDLITGRLGARPSRLKLGQIVHRLLVCLSSDTYRPFRLASLHHQLYTNEYFNPSSSPPRVHRAIQRFRGWAREGRLPLMVENAGGGQYRLASTAPFSIHVASHPATRDKGRFVIDKLRKLWPDRPF